MRSRWWGQRCCISTFCIRGYLWVGHLGKRKAFLYLLVLGFFFLPLLNGFLSQNTTSQAEVRRITVFSMSNEWKLNSWRHRGLLALPLPNPMNLSCIGAKWTRRWGGLLFRMLYWCWSMRSARAWDWWAPTTFVCHGCRSSILLFVWTSLDWVTPFPGGSWLLSVLCQIAFARLSKPASSWDWARESQSLQPKWHTAHIAVPLSLSHPEDMTETFSTAPKLLNKGIRVDHLNTHI